MTSTSFGAALSVQYDVVARTNVTPIPEGVGAYADFSSAPAIDNDGNVMFLGIGGADGNGTTQVGIYTYIGGQNQKVADRNTPVPGGGGATFANFYGTEKSDIDGGRVAFKAKTSITGTTPVLFSNVGQTNPGDLVQVALADGTEWSALGDPWVDGNIVGITGTRLIPSEHSTILRWNGSALSSDYVNVDDGYSINASSQASIAGNATGFRRWKIGSSQLGIHSGGIFESLVTSNVTPIPGNEALTFLSVSNFAVIDQGGLDIAFRGNGNELKGVYKRVNGGALEVVADTTTVVPEGGTVPGHGDQVFGFFAEDTIAMADGQVVFLGTGINSLEGIYTDIGGTLSMILDNQDNNTIELDGQTEQVTAIGLSHKSFAYTPQGYMVVFRATLQSGGHAIIRATINSPEQSSPDALFNGGFEN